MGNLSTIQIIIVSVLPVLFAITLHEVGHGYAAYKLGDKTAYMLGRLSLNPIRHIDPIGTVILPAILIISGAGFLFGWAKPVPVISRHLKNPKTDMMIIAAAGPFANFLMAIFWAILAKAATLGLQTQNLLFVFLAYMGLIGITVNCVLLVLNLLPIPPLDGSKIFAGFLSAKHYQTYLSLEPYGWMLIIILLLTGLLSKIMMPAITLLQSSIMQLVQLN